MTDGAISHKLFHVRLDHRDQRSVNNPKHSKPYKEGSVLCGGGGEKRNCKSQKSVCSHFQQNSRKDYGTRGWRLYVRIGQPRVQRKHRHLNSECERKREEHQSLGVKNCRRIKRQVEFIEIQEIGANH